MPGATPSADHGASSQPPAADTSNGTIISAELDKSRRDVLDLSLRNPLLNFRPSGRRPPAAIPPSEVAAELLAPLAEPASDSNGTAARHTDNKLQTALTLKSLNLRLRETVRQARLSIEEQGVNILYLALGHRASGHRALAGELQELDGLGSPGRFFGMSTCRTGLGL